MRKSASEMKMGHCANEKGVSLIMAVATLMIFSLMALVVVFGKLVWVGESFCWHSHFSPTHPDDREMPNREM